jgi:glycosyltransferase involved in cell wall biosynthesis
MAIERALARACTDRVIAISERQSQEISGQYRIGRPEQFRVIPLGFDFAETQGDRACLRHSLGISQAEVAIGIVGRLCEVKNHDMFLQAAAMVLRDPSVGARFVIVGDGHLRERLERKSIRLGISDAVVFTGFRADAASIASALDIVALTSLNEGTPLTLIEGMSCGRPVVATEVGGVPDLMGPRMRTTDGFTLWEHGLTVPGGDVEAFARALRFLVERPQLRVEMGDRARAFVTTSLSRERLLCNIAELYKELVGLRPDVALSN